LDIVIPRNGATIAIGEGSFGDTIQLFLYLSETNITTSGCCDDIFARRNINIKILRMKLITIKESHYVQDLLVLKSRLEAEGIKCFLKNELTTQVFNLLPSMLVELQVPEGDLEKVHEIMQELENL
jgi:hypothetical protein